MDEMLIDAPDLILHKIANWNGNILHVNSARNNGFQFRVSTSLRLKWIVTDGHRSVPGFVYMNREVLMDMDKNLMPLRLEYFTQLNEV